MGALLTMSHVGVSLPGLHAPVDVLSDVSLDVDPGEIVGIAGESGSGKSMTGRALLGLLPDGATVRGSIRYGDRDLAALKGKAWQQIRGREIAMIFQDPTAALHPMLSVGAQLTEHMRLHLDLSKKAARARAVELLEQVRIPDPVRALKSFPHQFSGGMRQRLAIAIALAGEPKLLIADEPTTALDVTVQAGILRLLDRLARELDLSVLFITHDLGVLAALAHRTYVFYAGRIMETAPTQELLLRARHPYTKALLTARPETADVEGRPVALRPIPGQPVTASSAPPGCPFHPRCPDRVAACDQPIPVLAQVPVHLVDSAELGHLAACHVHAPAADTRIMVTSTEAR
jgi:oligopeptide/dipeptide ABC transporter ATP-binding protein